MDKAYDEKNNRMVYAVESARDIKAGERFYFRYRCICCEEYVTLAAANSKTTTPYFKHKRGGDHELCEAYTGNVQAGDFERIRKKLQNHRQVLYFNTYRSKLEFGIKFSAEEIDEFYKANKRVDIYTIPRRALILSTYITPKTFKPETRHFFEINKSALKYELCIGETTSIISTFTNDEGFYFFRETLKKEKFKKIEGDVLYLKTTYLVLSTDRNKLKKLKKFNEVDCINGISRYSILGKVFYGLKIVITEKNRSLNEFLDQYTIEKLESLYLLWPPSKMVDEYFVTDQDSIYVKSSFPIEEFKNTECSSYMQLKESSSITRMSLFDRIYIHEKNVNFTILRKSLQNGETHYPNIEENLATRCKVLDTMGEDSNESDESLTILEDYEFYLFEKGCRLLSPGEEINLSKDSVIIGYKNRHPRKIILPKERRKISKEDLLLDILRYYPKEEFCDPENLEKLSYKDYMSPYMERCKKRGRINSVVKSYLEEGRL